ncbi:26117_t:CDS:1, partial [Gigaspora margarita]
FRSFGQSFEATGLILNPDGSEDDKMLSYLQAIVADRINEASFSKEKDNESSNQDLDNEPNPNNNELDIESVMDCNSEDLVGYDSGDMGPL